MKTTIFKSMMFGLAFLFTQNIAMADVNQNSMENFADNLQNFLETPQGGSPNSSPNQNLCEPDSVANSGTLDSHIEHDICVNFKKILELKNLEPQSGTAPNVDLYHSLVSQSFQYFETQ